MDPVSLLTILVACLTGADCNADDKPVVVTVAGILAGTKENRIDPKLKDIAAEVQKKQKDFTSFEVVVTESQRIKPGDSAHFRLLPDEHPDAAKANLELKVHVSSDPEGKVKLAIKPPKLGEIVYECTCGKYFPVVTDLTTHDGKRLIVLIMAKPCTLKK